MFKSFKEYFVHPSPSDMRAEQLAKAERQLVEVEYTLEHYESAKEMLVKRIKRVKQHVEVK